MWTNEKKSTISTDEGSRNECARTKTFIVLFASNNESNYAQGQERGGGSRTGDEG